MTLQRDQSEQQILWLHPAAPAKPETGAPCNGCGLCCAAEPCPVAFLFLWQRKGRCRALEWDAEAGLYRCGMLLQPDAYLFWLPHIASGWFSRRVRRWIAAGTACDSEAELV